MPTDVVASKDLTWGFYCDTNAKNRYIVASLIPQHKKQNKFLSEWNCSHVGSPCDFCLIIMKLELCAVKQHVILYVHTCLV